MREVEELDSTFVALKEVRTTGRAIHSCTPYTEIDIGRMKRQGESRVLPFELEGLLWLHMF